MILRLGFLLLNLRVLFPSCTCVGAVGAISARVIKGPGRNDPGAMGLQGILWTS